MMRLTLSQILLALTALGVVTGLVFDALVAVIAVAAIGALLVVADAWRVRREERARRQYFWVSVQENVAAGAPKSDRASANIAGDDRLPPSHLGTNPR